MKTCCIKECEKPVFAKAMCQQHYRRMREHGNPFVQLQAQLHGKTAEERFNHYVIKCDGCWDWSGSKDVNGYGRLNINSVPALAHRVSWAVHNGPIPEGKHVLHKCDNPSCSNPDHLFLGTHRENVADKMQKDRHRYGVSKGEKHGCSKLTEDQVREIRASKGSSLIIAKQYGVSGRTVREIRTRQSWAHLP